MSTSTPPFHEPPPGPVDALELVGACMQTGAQAVLLSEVPTDFMDLSNGIAGEVLHKLSTYRLRMAAVLPAVAATSGPFQDFVREANRGNLTRFFDTRDEAIAWLEGESC